MFEYDDRFFNARYVKVIGRISETGMARFRFTVDFDGMDTVSFVFDSREDADRERTNLAIAVNKSNGE